MNLAAHSRCAAGAAGGRQNPVSFHETRELLQKGDDAMEYYDERRRQSNDEARYRSRSGRQDRGRDRESWWSQDDRPRRAERGWLDYDRDYGGPDERDREEPRYGQGREDRQDRQDRSRFSPDWSREDEEPRHSDDPYYARNRERGESGDYSRRRSEGRPSDDQRRWDQRARASVPRDQRELAERSGSGDYYSPDWPYERSGRDRGRDIEGSGDEDQDRHYRGYYRRSATPISYPGGGGYLVSESLTLHGPYAGRGPKGYKRSDQQIVEDACQRLERDGEIDASEIEVTAEDGVLKLQGTVPDRGTKRRAEDCVESVYGARDVMNELRVQREEREERAERDQRDQSQTSQSAYGSQGSQGSQATQGSQAGRGATPSQSSSTTSGRTATSTSEQQPKH
jgi:osmotically-inducible protein OsmY